MALPIDPILPALAQAVRREGRAVLQAPPGAGKTTRVPLALLDAVPGRILMLEPRRIAARAAAERLAEGLGEAVGGRVGYRMRGASVPGSRIEVVTEGLLTRMLQADPELPGTGCVIFDEFHERSLQADLGLAFTWEVRQALRPDLAVVVMSATLDAGPVAALLDDAPILTSEGRSFPVETRFLDAPAKGRLGADAAALIATALDATEGGLLAFLPGAREIRDVAARLGSPAGCVVRPLYGALPFAEQRAAIRPDPEGRRKVVLATAIAETSLTIEDVRVVVDAGRARRARFDPGSGMSRLVTERVTRAEATQRAGRAGRVAPGVAYRMWTKGEDGALSAFPPPEITAADLAPLALDLAAWGSPVADLAFLDPPPTAMLDQARGLLTSLGALEDGRLTEHGRGLARLPVHPRLGHMLLRAGAGAAPLAALLNGRDVMEGRAVALAPRLEALRDPGAARRRGTVLREAALGEVRAEARRLARLVPEGPGFDDAEAAALAYPDRIALRRPGAAPRYLLSGGKGAALDPADVLAGERLLVALDLDGDRTEARMRLAVPIAEAALRALFPEAETWHPAVTWSKREGRVRARRQQRLGALVLAENAWAEAPQGAIAAAMCAGIRQLGLGFGAAARRLQARAALVEGLPPMDDAALLDGLEDWLAPYLAGVTDKAGWAAFDPRPALEARLGWDGMRRLEAEVPGHFTTPLGRKVPIEYGGAAPAIAVRLQELLGQGEHPTVAGRPLLVTLLSPAGRPIQVTRDIPGFWAGSYADVRKDMRARYPKHDWPEDPLAARPTLRAKRGRPS
ncbi:MAG: ATP-dependent helicase HrpB [Shimia sp.]